MTKIDKRTSQSLPARTAQFFRDVRGEAKKTTWPSRKETLQTTGVVLAMVVIAALFFLTVDTVIGAGMRALFGVGS